MEFKATKTDEANAVITATITNDKIQVLIDKLAKQAAKSVDIQGFRKGKVPLAVVKQRFAQKLTQDAQGEAIKELLDKSLEELQIDKLSIIGDPAFVKFETKENKDIEVEIQISCKPQVELGDYESMLPEVKKIEVSDDEINTRLEELAKQDAQLTTITEDRAVQDKDFVVIDFEGFKDGVAFEGGKGEKYSLQIGSNSFIPGFEEQLIGMIAGEEKDITVTFPEDYQAKDLAGQEVVFKIKLHEIQEKQPQPIDDEFAKKMLPHEEDATLDKLKEQIKQQIKSEKTTQYILEELKPQFMEKLVEAIEFAVPESVLEQEINNAINKKANQMKPEEVEELKTNKEALDKIVEEVKPDAIRSVKATFIVDALAQATKLEVTDHEVNQTLYYEALMSGQDPQSVMKYYEEAGYIPAIKMSMLEQKVMTHIFNKKLEEE